MLSYSQPWSQLESVQMSLHCFAVLSEPSLMEYTVKSQNIECRLFKNLLVQIKFWTQWIQEIGTELFL